ncbi:MAG: phage tail spike protein, partial [Clostridia bacterium]
TAIYGTRATVLDCEDCTVEKGKKGVTLAVARKRMREQAQARFDTEKVDEPRITLKVSFVELGKTAEYEKYKPLENVYLWDDIVIAAKDYGIEAQAKVTKMVYDVLNDMVTEVELGDIDRTGKIYKWQVPAITGGMLSPGLRDNETPLITLSGGSFVVVADQNGICDAAVASYSILAWRGYTPVSPVLGTITGVPEGMTLTLGTIVNTGMLPLTLSVSKGATLGRVEQCAGQISIETIQPVATTLVISWAKVCKGDDGADGSIRQFVFKLMANDAVPTIDQNPNSMMEYIPQGWTDSPGGISESHPYEWMSYRDRLNGTWTGFGMPTIWAHWGVRGRDGDGVEYVYKLTGTDIAPGIETSSNQKDGYVPGGWTVDPSGVTRANPYEWVSTRVRFRRRRCGRSTEVMGIPSNTFTQRALRRVRPR